MIRDTSVTSTCPQCGSTFRAKLGDFSARRTVRCSRGHSIQLQEQGDGIRRADRALDDFKRSIDRLNRSMRRLR